MRNVSNILNYFEYIYFNFFLYFGFLDAIISHCFNDKTHKSAETKLNLKVNNMYKLWFQYINYVQHITPAEG